MQPDYFSLLGLAPGFDIDLKALEAAYFREQRLWHPDRFTGKPDQERQAAMQRSVDINRAYQTLKEPLPRAQYVLKGHGIDVGTEKDTVKPSQELLMEAMELRESPPPAAQITTLIDESLKRISHYSATSDWQNMAQEVLRLSYLNKVPRERKTA